MKKQESRSYTLEGDLAGMTVEDMLALLEDYPKDARIVVRREKEYGYSGWSDQEQEFFVITWEE